MSSLCKRSFLGAAFGTMIEYYDYAALGIFLPLISPLFFPGESAYDSLIKGYYALLIAMIARPIGGLAFGYIGDRLGRRKALLYSMYGIAFATLLIGFTPSYQVIGVWAGAIIIFSKAVQMFCFGGEYNGAGIYVVEHANHQNEAFIGSLLTSMMLVGSLAATLMGVLITMPQMPDWSWRIAFYFGGIFGILGVLYRKNLIESPQFKPAKKDELGFWQMIKAFPMEIIAGVFIGGFATLPFTTVITFINPVLMTKGFITSQQMMWLQSGLIFIAVITLLVGGKLADLSSPMKIMKISSLMLFGLSYPLLKMVDTYVMVWIIFAQIIFIVINELLLGPSNACLKNLFPVQYRYRAASFSFTLGMSLIGGLTPVIENLLYQHTEGFTGVAIWPMLIGLGTFTSLYFANKGEVRSKFRVKVA